MASLTTVLIVHGMSCASCEAKVRKALASLDGVRDVSVTVQTGRVVISHTAEVEPAQIAH